MLQAATTVRSTESKQTKRPQLLVFSDDWGRHPSSCQHLVRRLLRTYDVVWVNTIGMRPPRFDLATMSRVAEKLGHWTGKIGYGKSPNGWEVPAGLTVLNPRMWPWFRRSIDRQLNRRLLRRQLVSHLSDDCIAITTIPIVADLMDDLPVKKWIYYCVDDFSEWPGLDQAPLRRMEEVVVHRADSLIAVGRTLQEKLKLRGREADLLSHGVDLEFWSSTNSQKQAPQWVGKYERPLCMFWGVADRRLDFGFLQRLSMSMDRGTILLVGPQQNPPEEIAKLGNVQLPGPAPLDELPALGAAADVLIMPYVDQPVTRAMQPLKLLEYLATGKPVVVRDLPGTRPWCDCLDIANTADEFAAHVHRALRHGVMPSQLSARGRLVQESWDAKAELFEAHIRNSGRTEC